MSEVHEDPYPSQFAMEAAVELEVHACLGRVQTQTVGKVIQRAIDKASGPIEAALHARTIELYPDLQTEIARLRAEITQCSVELGEAAKLLAKPYPRTAGIFEEAAGRARVSVGLTPCEPPAVES